MTTPVVWKDSPFEAQMRREDAVCSVRHGMVWLDANVADWPQQIDVDLLDMEDPKRCVLGQVLGSVYAAPMTVDTAAGCGFIADPAAMLDPRPQRPPWGIDLPELTAAWRKAVIRRRRGAPARAAAAERYADLDDRHLAAHAAFEDELEDLGELHEAERVTCHSHRAWMWDCGLDPEHANPVHGFGWCQPCRGPMAECQHRGDLIAELAELRAAGVNG
ncbi:hypothetical protein GCM10010123_45800 [Pilimelia anulata]|uniref:Uncharacterized protein n=1 Tax=Pilimelia anulata TaxID=53371 RepID=A0A8J3BF73_9ACTN|nr:hypothetical protein [Pilimelia anulata]GGK10629.1 hypothetical protein GCM10010123_45800 [Pilimelia anulata]